MSQHPSLLGSQKGKQHRSVLKRYEKLKHLIEKEKWDEKKDSVYGLPKIKIVKFKVKKEKAAAAEETADATTAAGAPGAAPAAAAKTAPVKGAEGKTAPDKGAQAKK